jgi:hypothetical protein
MFNWESEENGKDKPDVPKRSSHHIFFQSREQLDPKLIVWLPRVGSTASLGRGDGDHEVRWSQGASPQEKLKCLSWHPMVLLVCNYYINYCHRIPMPKNGCSRHRVDTPGQYFFLGGAWTPAPLPTAASLWRRNADRDKVWITEFSPLHTILRWS